MRKTIDLSEENIKKIETYGKEKGIKTFTKSVQSIIDNFDGAICACEDGCNCNTESGISDDNFALLADALMKLDEKIEILLSHMAPKSAGEIK